MAHVLIIDDDDEVRGVLARLLHRDGHKTSEAKDGREGVAIQAAQRADVVITDIVMPEMEGFETISTLLRNTPTLPIIAISGVTNAQLYLAASLTFGAKFALGKPIAPGVLSQTVKSALGSATQHP